MLTVQSSDVDRTAIDVIAARLSIRLGRVVSEREALSLVIRQASVAPSLTLGSELTERIVPM